MVESLKKSNDVPHFETIYRDRYSPPREIRNPRDFRNFPGNEPGGVKGVNSKLLNFITGHVMELNVDIKRGANNITSEPEIELNVDKTTESDSSSTELEMELTVDNTTEPEMELNVDNTTEANSSFSEPEERIPNPKRKKLNLWNYFSSKKSHKTPLLLNTRPLSEFLKRIFQKPIQEK